MSKVGETLQRFRVLRFSSSWKCSESDKLPRRTILLAIIVGIIIDKFCISKFFCFYNLTRILSTVTLICLKPYNAHM